MTAFDEFMQVKLNERVSSSSKRKLALTDQLIDFSSNDYLGIALKNNTGSSGSRLISGNSIEAEQLEKYFSHLVGAEKYFSNCSASIELAEINLEPELPVLFLRAMPK
jgi:7-keto-8-aminopelargonate synthetase-like enzyme